MEHELDMVVPCCALCSSNIEMALPQRAISFIRDPKAPNRNPECHGTVDGRNLGTLSIHQAQSSIIPHE